MALRREENGWQIVHEHVSVPFYMDGSLRPAFDLQPYVRGAGHTVGSRRVSVTACAGQHILTLRGIQ